MFLNLRHLYASFGYCWISHVLVFRSFLVLHDLNFIEFVIRAKNWCVLLNLLVLLIFLRSLMPKSPVGCKNYLSEQLIDPYFPFWLTVHMVQCTALYSIGGFFKFFPGLAITYLKKSKEDKIRNTATFGTHLTSATLIILHNS